METTVLVKWLDCRLRAGVLLTFKLWGKLHCKVLIETHFGENSPQRDAIVPLLLSCQRTESLNSILGIRCFCFRFKNSS